MPEPLSAWQLKLYPTICEACDWRYLAPVDKQSSICPHCFQESLAPVAEPSRLPYLRPPELFLPFSVSEEKLASAMGQFAGGFWFIPGDLKFQHLIDRVRQIFIPMWLVDSQVQAVWQAEAGFNYEVVSYQDSYDGNTRQWASRRVVESRTRWEPRVGRLARRYHNITTPALEEDADLKQRLGPFSQAGAEPYRPEAVANSLVRLPDRSPAAAWPEALPAFQVAAAKECRQACQADHLRQFRWTAAYDDQNWTLLLLPVYTTYYVDDDGQTRLLLIHGRSARISGLRRASMKRARKVAVPVGALALLLFGAGLGIALASLVLPRLGPVAAVTLLAAILAGFLALIPLIYVWYFNASQEK